jgi:hypothetical protein
MNRDETYTCAYHTDDPLLRVVVVCTDEVLHLCRSRHRYRATHATRDYEGIVLILVKLRCL